MSSFPGRVTMLVNIGLYYAGWLACVLGAAGGHWEIGAAAGVALVGIHLGLAARRAVEWRLLLTVAPIGYAVDSVQAAAGLLVFAAGQPAWWAAPIWIGVMWMLFSATLRFAFAWLVGRWLLAAALGAAGGPAAYYAGHRLGAVDFHPVTGLSLAVLALVWAALLPALVRLGAVVGNRQPGSYTTPNAR